jgi:hypothetical protein
MVSSIDVINVLVKASFLFIMVMVKISNQHWPQNNTKRKLGWGGFYVVDFVHNFNI